MQIAATQPLASNQMKQLTPQQQYVKESLTPALNEVQEVKRTGTPLMSADDFLKKSQT